MQMVALRWVFHRIALVDVHVCCCCVLHFHIPCWVFVGAGGVVGCVAVVVGWAGCRW